MNRNLITLASRGGVTRAINRNLIYIQQNTLRLQPNANNALVLHKSSYSTNSKPFKTVEVKEPRETKRPVSPHLTIYRFPLPAILSITHRATGIAIGLGFVAIGAISILGTKDVSFYIEQFKTAYPSLVAPAKFCVSWPLVYHFMAGCRHLVWDETQKGITTDAVVKTGYAIVAASITTALLLSCWEL
eukprot:gene975-1240_t